MDDQNIIALYWARSETAISETAQKYGGYCFSIAKNILTNHEDAEESVNDTYLTAWNAMPPRRPSILATFLGKITRRLAIDRWRYRNACKRGGGEVTLALDELEDCASQDSLEKAMDRLVFLSRYWYLDPIADIAEHFGFSVSKVTSMLRRTRGRLRQALEKEELL